MIHASLDQSISYQKREFEFFQGNIINHLRLPYQIHSNDLPVTVDQIKNRLAIRRGLYYANQYWLSMQSYCYQKSLVLQNLPDYFYYPSIYPLFYQPLRFRIELIGFLKQFRTFSELVAFFTDAFQLPILINSQLFIKALIAFEIQCLAAQKLLIIIDNKFKIIDQKSVQVSVCNIQSPLQINQWLSAQLRDGKRNEKRKIIDS